MSDHSITELDISGLRDEIGVADEVARVFVGHEGKSSFLINPVTIDDPSYFGRLMVDMMKHGALAYSQRLDIEPQEAFEAITKGFFTQLEKKTEGSKGDA